MMPTQALREQAMKLLAADATTLAPAANANKIALIKAPFNPSETLQLSDLTLADFTGSTPLLCGLNAQNEALDPYTGDAIIDLIAPVGGWRWETTNTANLPQNIYGFCLVDNGVATLLASQALDSPISLTAANQAIVIPRVDLRQLKGSIS